MPPIGKGDVATFDRVIATNLRGAFLVLARAAQQVAAGGRDITVNAVAPGPVGTDLFLTGKGPEQIAELSKLAPLGGFA
ncbi:MAG TPA: hypothetical protein VGF49_08630 [Candidatus Solibacter sp.]